MVLGDRDGAALAAPPANPGPPSDAQIPLTQILDKLDQVLADLQGVTPNWDKNLPSASRFTVLAAFGGHAVRDNNTGLVWQQEPDIGFTAWPVAAQRCANKSVGGTVGWRLPSVAELKSVQDPSLPAPFVPASVFTGIQSAGRQSFYWSATAGAATAGAWVVPFNDDQPEVVIQSLSNGASAWCVRGPMQESVY